MSDTTLANALARVICVAAWRCKPPDVGALDCWKDLAYLLPGTKTTSWRRVGKLFEKPVAPAAQTRYLNALARELASDAAEDRAIYAFERIMQADSRLQDEEARLVRLFIAKHGEDAEKSLPILIRLLERPLELRQAAASRAEKEFAPVGEVVAGRVEDWRDGGLGFAKMPENDLRRLCLAGILLAGVIHADDCIDERELCTAIDFLVKRWRLSREQAEFVMIVSFSEEFSELDFLRINRWLFEVTTLPERKCFLELLFDIAAADGELHQAEIDEIMRICANLHLDHVHFQRCLERIDAEKAS